MAAVPFKFQNLQSGNVFAYRHITDPGGNSNNGMGQGFFRLTPSEADMAEAEGLLRSLVPESAQVSWVTRIDNATTRDVERHIETMMGIGRN